MSRYSPTMNLPPTGHRQFKYRVLTVTSDARTVEDTMNRLAGHGYKVIGQTTKGDNVRITFERETRKSAGVSAAPSQA